MGLLLSITPWTDRNRAQSQFPSWCFTRTSFRSRGFSLWNCHYFALLYCSM